MFNIYYIISRITHPFLSGYRKGHHVHSPFVYSTLNNIIFEHTPYYSFKYIENISKNLDKNNCFINKKQRELLQRLCALNNAKTIVELNSGNGLSALYLASNSSKSTVYTYETDKNLYDKANILIKESTFKNIKLTKKENYTSYKESLQNFNQIDLLHINMNKNDIYDEFIIAKNKSTKNSIFVFSGISKSKINKEIWKKIIKDEKITLSIEIFNMGIIWFNSELQKQHYKVAY